MKDMSRSIRRHHIARLKDTRKFYWGYGSGREGTMTETQAGKVVQYPAVCSCYMCGNERRYWKKKTIQERKFLQEPIDFGGLASYTTNMSP